MNNSILLTSYPSASAKHVTRVTVGDSPKLKLLLLLLLLILLYSMN